MPHIHWVARQNKLEIPRDKDGELLCSVLCVFICSRIKKDEGQTVLPSFLFSCLDIFGDCSHRYHMQKMRCIVTGGSSGIGEAICKVSFSMRRKVFTQKTNLIYVKRSLGDVDTKFL